MQSREAQAAVKPCCQYLINNETLSMGGDAFSPSLALGTARMDSHQATPAPTKLVPPFGLTATKDVSCGSRAARSKQATIKPYPWSLLHPGPDPWEGSQGLACVVPLNPWLGLDVHWQESPRHSAVLQLSIPSHPDGWFQGCLFSSRLFKETLLRMRD